MALSRHQVSRVAGTFASNRSLLRSMASPSAPRDGPSPATRASSAVIGSPATAPSGIPAFEPRETSKTLMLLAVGDTLFGPGEIQRFPIGFPIAW